MTRLVVFGRIERNTRRLGNAQRIRKTPEHFIQCQTRRIPGQPQHGLYPAWGGHEQPFGRMSPGTTIATKVATMPRPAARIAISHCAPRLDFRRKYSARRSVDDFEKELVQAFSSRLARPIGVCSRP